MESKNIGKVVQIVGAVVDVRFEKDSLPDLLNAIEIDNKGEKLVVEVAQHIGDDIVRCIAMGSTDGLVRGIDAVDTGKAIFRSGGQGNSFENVQSSGRAC